MNTDEEPIAKRRRLTKERKARWLAKQSQESLDRIRAVDAAAYRRRIEAETPPQSQARRERNAETHHIVRDRQRIRDKTIHFIEAQVETDGCRTMNIICQFCKSKNFAVERPFDVKFTSCYRKGKIKLEKPSDALGNDLLSLSLSLSLYPNFLLDLLTNPNNPDYKHFLGNTRSYNSAISFASMGAKVVDFSCGVPYVFKVHGQICHHTSHIQSVNG
ncbi:hypothetical protein AVEN_15144-1 [Araneus ventricosus]|uniref:Helitron helicase-like domain-containing protein n=1 Tax=Araneus ventricosus TaxID=182803 RepID=A0A4Y2KKE7_ARAVE|nr:hypothetical protein AVEN_15144-1 [Araneus ventricosus]